MFETTTKMPAVDANLSALIEALLPAGRILPGPDPMASAQQVQSYLRSVPGVWAVFSAALKALDARFLLSHQRRFSSAPLGLRRQFLQQQQGLSARLIQMLSLPVRAGYLLDEDTQRLAGARNIRVPAALEQQRWQQQVTPVSELEGFTELEADVVVIGTGAGGAAAAYEFASKGLAVVMVEEGHYHDRRDFNGRLGEIIPKLYRASGAN